VERASSSLSFLTIEAETFDIHRPEDVERVLSAVRRCCPEG